MRQRRLKVSYFVQGRRFVPMIRLRGSWLEEYGFLEGRIVEVEAAEGKITLTIKDEDLPDSAFAPESHPVAGAHDASYTFRPTHG